MTTEPVQVCTPADTEALAYVVRAASCLKTAAEISPHLVTKLGTPHSLLVEVVRELERVR